MRAPSGAAGTGIGVAVVALTAGVSVGATVGASGETRFEGLSELQAISTVASAASSSAVRRARVRFMWKYRQSGAPSSLDPGFDAIRQTGTGVLDYLAPPALRRRRDGAASAREHIRRPKDDERAADEPELAGDSGQE